MIKRKILSLITCVAIAFTMLPAQVFAAVDPVTVTVFTTNDIHGTVAGEGIVGMAQAAAMKASTENALLIDAGDATQGATFATVSQGKDVIEVMNAAGYDAMAAGNHEFDYGTEQLLANVEAADFPILSANVTLNGNALLEPSAVVEAGGKKIGLIGLTTTSTLQTANPSKLNGVAFTDEVAAAKAQIAALKDDTDTIIIVSHLGDNASAVSCTSAALLDALTADELAEISAVIDGHSHTVEQTEYKGVALIQTGVNFTGIGKLTLTFDGDVSAEAEVLDAAQASAYTINADGEAAKANVESVIEQVTASQKDLLGETLCTAETTLWGGNIVWDYSEARVVETNYGDFVTDAFASYAKTFASQNGYTQPIVAVENGGGISAALPSGKVTKGDILSAFNHGNMVEVYAITPAMLCAAVEAGLTTTGQDDTGLLLRERVSGSFLQVSGFTYTYDPASAKVTNITLNNGTALDLSDSSTTLLLATNGYVGGNFAKAGAEKLGELGGEDQIVSEYILQQTDNGSKPLNVPVDGKRILIEDDRSPDTYTVTIPVYDETTLDSTPGATITENSETIPNYVVMISVDGAPAEKYVTDGNGAVTLTLSKGPHELSLDGSDSLPVYVNNYSGSFTATTKEGYYRLGFAAEKEQQPNYNIPSTPSTSSTPSTEGVSEEEIEEYINSIKKFLERKQEINSYDQLTDEEKAEYGRAVDEIVNNAVAALQAAASLSEAEKLYDEYYAAAYAKYAETWILYAERFYDESIKVNEFATEEEKARSVQALAELFEEMKAASKEGKLDLADYFDKLNAVYSYSYIPHLYRYYKTRIDNFNNLTDDEKAPYYKQLEDTYTEAHNALETAPFESSTIALVYSAADAMTGIDISAWAADCINWTNGIILSDFDAVISEYSDRLNNISEEELASIRKDLEEKADTVCAEMKEMSGQDDFSEHTSEFDAIREAMQTAFDDAVKQVFITDALDRLKAEAQGIKTDSETEKLLSDAKTDMQAVETEFSYVYHDDALAAFYDEISALLQKYEAQLNGQSSDNPSTGFMPDFAPFFILMTASGCLAVLSVFDRTKAGRNRKS